jgi:hypothetical protein
MRVSAWLAVMTGVSARTLQSLAALPWAPVLRGRAPLWPRGHPKDLTMATARRTLKLEIPIYVHVLYASLSLGGMKICTIAAAQMAIPSPPRTSSRAGSLLKVASVVPCGQLDHSTASAKAVMKIARKIRPVILKLGTHRLQDRVQRCLKGSSIGHLAGLAAVLALR